MHAYASDSFFRGPKVYLVFGLVAVTAASAMQSALSGVGLPSFLSSGAISVSLVYGALVFVYDRWLWARFSSIPDLRGTWLGTVESSHNGGTQTSCVVRVHQNWTRIFVELETADSRSRTTMAAILQEHAGDRGLKYEFITEPKGRAADTLQIARGVCNLGLPDDKDQMSGSYYTGRGRMNHGEITLKRASRKHLSYESAQGLKTTS